MALHSSVRALRFVANEKIVPPPWKRTLEIFSALHNLQPHNTENDTDLMRNIELEWSKLDGVEQRVVIPTLDSDRAYDLLERPFLEAFMNNEALVDCCPANNQALTVYLSYVDTILRRWLSYYLMDDSEYPMNWGAVLGIDLSTPATQNDNPPKQEQQSLVSKMKKKKAAQRKAKNAKKPMTTTETNESGSIQLDQKEETAEVKAKKVFGRTLLDRLMWALLIPHPHEYVPGRRPVPHILPSSCYLETVVARLGLFSGAISEVSGL